jgi:thymidylate kinase
MTGTYIELVGVAGVGKTTTAKILVDEARTSKVSIRTRVVVGKNLWLRVRTMYTIMMVVMSVPEIFSLYLVRTRNAYTHTPHIRRIIHTLVTRMIVDTAVIRCLMRQSSEYIVNDEGLIGKLVSLSVLTEIAPSKVHALIEKLLPKPVMLVYVTSSPLTALERERARDIKLPFFNDMAYELKEKFFYEAVRMYEALPTAIGSMSNVKSISIDNAGTYDDLTTEVASVVERIRAQILRG